MRRVLLSPNLVFEASRSSTDEPRTYGPSGEDRDGSPDLPHALGRPVPITLSTILLRHLATRNKLAIAPAITRRWNGCTDGATCPPASWVERVLLQAQRARMEQMSAEERENFPDSVLAIRTFGPYAAEIPLVAIRNEGTKTIELRKRRFPDEKSDCDLPPMRTFGIALEAELLNIGNGTLIARIDERNLPKVPNIQKREVAATAFEPQWSLGYDKESGGSPRLDTSYKYISGYIEKDVLCENVRLIYEKATQLEVTTPDIQRVANELLDTAFKPLWGN
jgi:hypothetical protein